MARPAPKYQIIDDEGKLTGEVGATLELTSREICERSGLPYALISKRLGSQFLRSWSKLTKSPALAMKESRARWAGVMRASTIVDQDDRQKKRARDERVRKGHRSL